MRVGGTVQNTLKVVEQNRGERTQVFKKSGGKLGQGVDALKRRATGTPLLTMNDLILPVLFILT